MSKKYFVFSDVHGFYNELMNALNKAGFDINNEDHIIVSCGDLLDRGSKPLECLQFVNSLPENRKILVKGNHESLLDDLFITKHVHGYDVSNGTIQTITAISKINDPKRIREAIELAYAHEDVRKYYDSLVKYGEVGDYIFVHGWVPTVKYDDLSKCSYDEWEEAMWFNGMYYWDVGARIPNKTIVCGHWNTSYGHTYIHHIGSEYGANSVTDIFKDDGIVALDACTVISRKVNVFTFEMEEK